MDFHRGILQVLPPMWEFAIMTCKKLIGNQYVGNKIEKFPPLEVLSALHVAHLGNPGNQNSGKVKLRNMRCVMATLEKYAKKGNWYLIRKGLWTSEYTKIVWEKIGEKYLISKFGG